MQNSPTNAANSLNFIAPELQPQQSSAEPHWLDNFKVYFAAQA